MVVSHGPITEMGVHRLLREMPHIEAAARLSWKDECAELNALHGAIKV